MLKNGTTTILACILALLPSVHVWSLGNDSNEPVVIDADETELDFKTGQRTWIGNVLVQQGSMTINADRLVATYKDNVLQKAVATGKDGQPAVFKQLPEGSDQEVIGKGKLIVLDEVNNLLTLQDQASLAQGQNLITGCVINYDIAREKLRAHSGDGCEGGTTTKVLQNPDKKEKKNTGS